MKQIILIVITIVVNTHTIYASSPSTAILPAPLFLKEEKGVCQLKKQLYFSVAQGTESSYFQQQLQGQFGFKAVLIKSPKKAQVVLKKDAKKVVEQEGYELQITPSVITITGHDDTGVFYGIQSLLQLMQNNLNAGRMVLPCLYIKDAPRFGWRAFMLDEARFFKGEKTVKQLLDEMAALKMNVFHWHLTDDQGWRVESKKYPLLTIIGSKRKDTQSGGWNSKTTYGEPHEGFYTQEQIKEIVQYAKQRHIKVVPEIEMPGHASAAIAAYPWLGSSADTIQVPVTFGKHYAVFNVTNPKVEQFLHEVVEEMIILFETDVIHIGGDEVRFTQWEKNETIRNYKEEKKFSSFMDIQIEFTNRMSKFIESKNCRMMGWNEILGNYQHKDDNIHFDATSQKIASNVIVHFWVGDLKEIGEAVKSGYQVVNSHNGYTYLDYDYNSISLEKAYNFNPVPANLPAEFEKNIIGTGCQMWSEWIPTIASMQEKIFPRIAAYAETGWTAQQNKNFQLFQQQLVPVIKRWKAMGIKVHE